MSGEDFSLGCAKSIEECLNDDLHFDVVSLKMLSHGSHWISIPLKVDGSATGGQSIFFAKAVTERGLRNFNFVVCSGNLRFCVLADQKSMLFQNARSPWEILRYEAETLKNSGWRTYVLLLRSDCSSWIAAVFAARIHKRRAAWRSNCNSRTRSMC